MSVEEGFLGQGLEEEGGDEHEEGDDDGDEGAGGVLGPGGLGELPGDDLDAVLEVDPGDIEAEGVAGEEGDVFEEVTPWRRSDVSNWQRLRLKFTHSSALQ